MKIPYLDLKRQYKQIQPEITKAVQTVIEKQDFILGEQTKKFEEEFASYLGAKYVIGVGNGTDGLMLSLWALGVGKGDEVITPVNSFIATTLAITQLGATPVFVDCDKDTYQIDVNQVAKKITKRTKVILPVHLYGAPCEIDTIIALAKKNKIFVLEDAAQAHGSTFKNKKLGTFGDMGIFSFYPGKNLGAYGDAGAICTNSKKLYEKVTMLRNYGAKKKYFHTTIGINSRLDEVQAAVLRIKLKHLEAWNTKRIEHVQQYKTLLPIKFQKIIAEGRSNYHIVSIEVNKRDELQARLLTKGIQTLIHYPVPIHLQKCYEYLGYKKGDFPIAENIAKKILSLPLFAELTALEIKEISTQISTEINA